MPSSRGDVVLVLFPDSNVRSAKRRPALVVQRDDLGTHLPQTIVAMITSNMSRAGHPSRVGVTQSSPQGKQMGLLTDSAISTASSATAQRRRQLTPRFDTRYNSIDRCFLLRPRTVPGGKI